MPKNKKKRAPRRREKESTPQQQLKRRLGELNWRLLGMLALNTVILFAIYRVLVSLGYFIAVSTVYGLILLVLICAYIIYNRGLVPRSLTPEQLPEAWTDAQKQEFLVDAERRNKRSKWMLTIIFPLCITFCYEIISLYIFDVWS